MKRTRLRYRTKVTYRRAGFTLVELLIVISIIAILAALSAAAAMMLIGTQKKSTTQLIIQKTAAALDQQWKAVVDQAKQEPLSPAEMSLAGNDTRRAKVIHIHLRLRQEFPETYAEAVSAITDNTYGINIQPKNAYVKALTGHTVVNPATQSSACLLLALSQPRRGMSFNADQALGSGAILDTDGDGMKEIIDVWQTALGFWRWPTGNTELRNTLSKNPLDPEDTLVAPSWNNAQNQQAVTTFENLCGGGYSIHTGGGGAWQPVPARTRPVVGSAGPDKTWGIDLTGGTMQPDGTGSDGDNLYSYRLSLGGRGD